jgi:hypothetical protein
MGSGRIVKHHLLVPRHAGTRPGSRTYHTSSLLEDSRHEPPRDESVPVERRLLASGFRRVVSATGGLQLAEPPSSRARREQP